MALTYNRQVRTLGIRGVITLATGAQINLSTEDVIYYSISESCGEEGLPLGTAEAASFELTISNIGKGYTPHQFDNAEVHMQIGIETNGVMEYDDFGVWYVCNVNAPEQSVSIDLSGYDALATLFEAEYTDSENAYPTNLAELASTICAAAGISLRTTNFVNSDIEISKMPEWGETSTLRSIIGYISACAGGFAHIDRSGFLEIASYNSGSLYEFDSDLYHTLTRTNGTNFNFNALQVKYIDSDDDTYSRYAVQTSIEDNPTNTIRIENNPLFNEGVSNSVLAELTGLAASPASVGWVGDPSVYLGDTITVTNTSGESIRIIINSQSFSFSGGLSAESACSLPALNTTNSSSYTSSGNIIDGNGNINAKRITNLDKTIVSATVGHFNSLDAETIQTDTLLASIISATTLKANSINAETVDTDILTTALAAIIQATIRKLQAGTITTDDLFASYAELFTLKTNSINAANILTDKFAAELARITVLAAGSASFDRATVAHLVAQAMNLEYGTAGQVFIRNLAVEYAQMVGAAIGNLCIKASDGNYYRIDVRPDGTVSAVRTTVSEGEIAAGQTEGGRVILETNITAANLSAGNLLATYALVNRIDAARIDVDALFAREAFITALTTSRIFGGESLEIIAGRANEASRVFRQEEFPDGTTEVRPGDMLVNPSTGQQYQAVQSGSIRFALDADGSLYYEYDGDGSLNVDGFGLYADGFAVSVSGYGSVGTPYNWELVQDSQIANTANDALSIANAALSQADFQRVVRIDDAGLHVGDNQTDYEVLLDSASVNIVAAGVRVSTFSDKFIRLDNMQIRKVRGGLAISVYKG